MPNSFCRYLSNGFSFKLDNRNQLLVTPCCWFNNPIPVVDGRLLDDHKKSFGSIKTWVPDCNKCQQLEQAGQQSMRQAGSDWISNNVDDNSAVSIDINLDIECNAACVICSKSSSTLWSKEIAKQNKQKYKIQNDNLVHQHIQTIVKNLDLKKLTYVKFFGGEPLFTDSHLQFIKQIPFPEQVTLHYTTNASIYPNMETLALWKKFKCVIFAASLDGIADQFDYVRWPLPWKKVTDNLKRLQANTELTNLVFRVEFTANFLNAYYYDRLETWVKHHLSSNHWGDATEIGIHPCHGTWDLKKMPQAVRDLVLEKYAESHVMHKLVKNLPEPDSLSVWAEFVNRWDSVRNNSWKLAFPELASAVETALKSQSIQAVR